MDLIAAESVRCREAFFAIESCGDRWKLMPLLCAGADCAAGDELCGSE